MSRGADIGASMCHLPLAPEGNETQRDFTEGYQLLMGMDPTTPKVRDTPEIQRIWWKKFFECCTCFQQTDLSAALSWKKTVEDALPAKNGKQKICKSKGTSEARLSQPAYEGLDPGLILGTFW